MSDGKYGNQSGFGAMVRDWGRSRERAATKEDASSGGGGVLGYAFASFSWPGTVQSNGADNYADAASIDLSFADPDLDVDPGFPDSLIYAAASSGMYVVSAQLQIQATTNAVSTDVHMVDAFVAGIGAFSLSFIGTTPVSLMMSGIDPRDTPTGGGAYVALRCTGGTNRIYTAPEVGLSIARLNLPV